MADDYGFEHSEWFNPTKTPVVLDLCINANAEPGKIDRRLKLSIPPQGTPMGDLPQGSPHQVDAKGNLLFTRLSRAHDSGIHQVRDGLIVGGHGTRLRRYKGEQLPLAPGLDSAQEDHNQALREATMMLEQKRAADEALMISAAKQLKAEKALEEQKPEPKPEKGK